MPEEKPPPQQPQAPINAPGSAPVKPPPPNNITIKAKYSREGEGLILSHDLPPPPPPPPPPKKSD